MYTVYVSISKKAIVMSFDSYDDSRKALSLAIGSLKAAGVISGIEAEITDSKENVCFRYVK